MNINININDSSDATDDKTVDTMETSNSVADAGLPPSDIAVDSADGHDTDFTNITASTEDGHVDIGGPPEWLLQAISETSEVDDVTAATNEDMDDGGTSPELD
ncbi:hypothetical protein [Zobellia sp. B3R18]|uniref:hypothetical protein n=1 Tax=Zobellia sp. B3R18 TaxID=2841568 RepID=UPI001C07E22F|nr:hypothetical protein [Zobellia sp. B3R18]MBU2974075.1 hypothetical protein [Zobellia sp. B3R18]